MNKKTKTPFKTVSKNLPFWPDSEKEHNEPFTGVYVSSTHLGDDPDPLKHIPAYIFADINTGEEFFIIQSYAVKKVVETALAEHKTLVDVVFSFTFNGKTMKKDGKPFNNIDTGYCTLEEWEIYTAEPQPELDGKKKK